MCQLTMTVSIKIKENHLHFYCQIHFVIKQIMLPLLRSVAMFSSSEVSKFTSSRKYLGFGNKRTVATVSNDHGFGYIVKETCDTNFPKSLNQSVGIILVFNKYFFEICLIVDERSPLRFCMINIKLQSARLVSFVQKLQCEGLVITLRLPGNMQRLQGNHYIPANDLEQKISKLPFFLLVNTEFFVPRDFRVQLFWPHNATKNLCN